MGFAGEDGSLRPHGPVVSWSQRLARLVSLLGLVIVVGTVAGVPILVGNSHWPGELGAGLGGVVSLPLLLVLAFGLARRSRLPGTGLAVSLASLLALFCAAMSPWVLSMVLSDSQHGVTGWGGLGSLVLFGAVVAVLQRMPSPSGSRHSSQKDAGGLGGTGGGGGGGSGDGAFFGGLGDGGGGC